MKVFVKEARSRDGSGSKIIGSGVEEIRDAASASGKTGLVSATVEAVHPEDKSVTLLVDRQGNLSRNTSTWRKGRSSGWISKRWRRSRR